MTITSVLEITGSYINTMMKWP